MPALTQAVSERDRNAVRISPDMCAARATKALMCGGSTILDLKCFWIDKIRNVGPSALDGYISSACNRPIARESSPASTPWRCSPARQAYRPTRVFVAYQAGRYAPLKRVSKYAFTGSE